MSKQSPKPAFRHRDGTSQAGRHQKALDPDYVSVDERSVEDLLAFAMEYAKELKYFNVEDQDVGDWRAFLDSEMDLNKVVAFMDDPAKFMRTETRELFRPHFVLFLTFLKILHHAQDQLNTLTRRHLDFYYKQILQMREKSAVPDQVHILFEPASDVSQIVLPAGITLNAGTDSQGQDRIYRTDHEIVINRAQIARLSSVHVHKRITGIREAREQDTGTKEDGFMAMLGVALGNPMPGDPLPPYETGDTVDYAYLISLQRIVDFVRTGLFMRFPDLRSLMRLKQNRDHADAEWNRINAILEKAGQTRLNDPSYRLEPSDRQDFDANLRTVLGSPTRVDFDKIFDGIPEVDDVYDAYYKRERADLKDAIRQRVEESLFLPMADFTVLMQLKIRIDNDWTEINSILEQAGQNKRGDPSYRLVPNDPKNFESYLEAAIGPDFSVLTGVDNIDKYYGAVLRVEKYFCMSAEDFSYLMSVGEKPDSTPREWNKVYGILADAHKERVYEGRRQQLKAIREDKNKGFDAMIHFALGEDPAMAELSPLERLKEFVRRDEDYDFLKSISKADVDKVTDEEWDRVYRIVEIAQRIREKFPEPVARKEEWRNLHPYQDATTVSVSLGIEADKDNPRWKTFGQKPPEAVEDAVPSSVFGWAINSPVLQLSEGQRTIALTLGFHSDHFDESKIAALLPKGSVSAGDDQGPFRIELSTEKGWIAPDSVDAKQGDYSSLSGISNDELKEQVLKALQFTLTFSTDADAVAPLPVEEAQIDTRWPVLRLIPRRQISGEKDNEFVVPYQHFKDLVLARINVKVDVSGLTTLQIQNDEAVPDAKKPFEPFGTRPSVGSRFFLGHPELVCKRLDSLTFKMDWMGVPGNLQTHYANYDLKWPDNNFTACISLIDKRVTLPLEKKAPLFSSLTEVDAKHFIEIYDLPKAVQAGRPGYIYKRSLVTPVGEDILTWDRYLQWELNAPSFQQETYPTVAAKKSIEMAAAIAKSPGEVDEKNYQVSPPYTPKIKKLSLDYTSSEEIVLKEYQPGFQIDRIFHIHPFGYNEVQPDIASQGYFFLPQYYNEGELYIGIKDLQPPENLSILFQMAEGSADPNLEPVPIQWSYLSGNRWKNLHEGNILFDSTRGLINSGIITFKLEPVEPSTRLPKDLYWIRATVAQYSNSVCDTVAIQTQAVSATFVDNNNAPDHYSRPLPTGSITELVEPMPEIASVRQPYTSYGAKMKEQDNIFYTRVSERLRHKNRALTSWDYERLVLEQFPQIYKVKCLPANVKGRFDELGTVKMIIIPNIRDQLPFDPFEPKASAKLVADIESYLSDKTPAYATVKVRNAHFVSVKVRVGVRFKQGLDEGYYKKQLNDELNRFLSPWAYEEGKDIVIGGKIYANSIINFIDERDYVDYLAQIELFKSEDGIEFDRVQPIVSQGYFVMTKGPDEVLVAARQHVIDIISETGYTPEEFTGIDFMMIELDFIVG